MTEPISSDSASILSVLADIEKFQKDAKTSKSPLLAEAVSHVPALLNRLPVELMPAAQALIGDASVEVSISDEQRQLANDIRQWSCGPR